MVNDLDVLTAVTGALAVCVFVLILYMIYRLLSAIIGRDDDRNIRVRMISAFFARGDSPVGKKNVIFQLTILFIVAFTIIFFYPLIFS